MQDPTPFGEGASGSGNQSKAERESSVLLIVGGVVVGIVMLNFMVFCCYHKKQKMARDRRGPELLDGVVIGHEERGLPTLVAGSPPAKTFV